MCWAFCVGRFVLGVLCWAFGVWPAAGVPSFWRACPDAANPLRGAKRQTPNAERQTPKSGAIIRTPAAQRTKSEGAPGFPEAPSLCRRYAGFCPRHLRGGGRSFLSRALESARADDPSRSPRRQCDYYPEAVRLRGRARRRASCYVLHRRRFFVPRALLRGRWALTPPFHPYPQPLLRGTVGGLIFCDTVCRRALACAAPVDSPRPAVWWCPDFPLAGEPRAIVCQRGEATREAGACKDWVAGRCGCSAPSAQCSVLSAQ